ncbi:hypothetical protein D0T12_13430 [Actinomadura spongiicola]|uniref:DUF6745 domain-containing protein n=1 Tax=Actinomadura spongiicola TaxID=2303421 RepID=A0A372GGP7_9ACTN|nr:hypothetical protein [Actinomadura spongiicola]RFS84556.1 hypothetical protein D0T12_13430 [Actinomadura spongiicola]
MTALARREDAAFHPHTDVRYLSSRDRWREAAEFRREWLDHALSTRPADRRATERSLTAIYARLSRPRPRPRFVWVDSPKQAMPLVGGWPTVQDLYAWLRDPRPPGPPPLASDLAMVAHRLRGSLGAGVVHADPEVSPVLKGRRREPWPDLPPPEALRAGVPLGVVLHRGIHDAMHRTLGAGFRGPVHRALTGGSPGPVCWYGQQDAAWIAYYDVLHRLGLARYRPDDLDHLGHWAALARSCGWWWPGDEVCVVVERPESVHAEAVPGTRHDEVRLGRDGVRYRDGWHPRPG